MKMWVQILALLMIIVCNFASAKIVEVKGMGDTKETATSDAMRNAVEQVVGTFVDSRTLVNQAVAVEDEIYSKAQGFVTSVDIIDEGRNGEAYYVRARVDVNTNPDSQLQDRMQMIMLLGDPRIGVVVFKNQSNNGNGEYGNSATSYDDITEQAINERLLSLGFNHVADINMVSKLRNSALLNSVYNGDTNLIDAESNYGIDILVLIKSSVDATKISLTKQDGSLVDTQLIRGTADINGKVIIFDTGYIKGSFTAQGQGIDISDATAQNKALRQASEKIAKEVERILRGEAAKVFNGVQIIASTDDYGKVERLAEDLKKISGIQDVHIREHQAGKGIIEVETTLKPHIILRLLREKTELGLFNEGITDKTMNLRVS